MAFKKLKFWFDKDLAILLADKLQIVDPKFDKKNFVKSINSQINDLELKARVEVFADELHKVYDADYKSGITNLMKILGPENEEETGMFTNYYWIMPIAKYVEKYGLGDFNISIDAIVEITKRNTSEYAIRPYIEKYEAKTLKHLKKWAKDKNKHVRRLASEGPRPRLPWAPKIDKYIKDPTPILPILNQLKDDESKYVQKSVANCINDILKDNLDVGKSLIDSWNKPDAGKERKWIIKHALRNMTKKNDPWALKVVG